MSLRFCSLGSSSAGNCYYVSSADGTRILIDAGLPLRRLEARLRALGTEPGALQGVFLTHAHRDHVASYLIRYPFVTRHGLHSYATTPTWQALLSAGCGMLDHDYCHRLEAGQTVAVGEIAVTALAKPHDAAGAVCFRVAAGGVSLAVVTDLGHLPEDLLQGLQGCDYYIFEANHDEQLERLSDRPWSLKQRVLGDRGHLSNEQAAAGLVRLARGARGIWLAHLSEECNRPDLATQAVKQQLCRAGIEVPVAPLPAHEVSPFLGEEARLEQLRLFAEGEFGI